MWRRNERPSCDLAIAAQVVAGSSPGSVVEGHDDQWRRNIYTRELEELLLQPNLVEASVVGRPHPDRGEEAVAFPVPRPGAAIGPPNRTHQARINTRNNAIS
jgi:hypothetical protein